MAFLAYGGLRTGVGSEDTFFLKGIIQVGLSGTRFDHGRFEIKTFPTYALTIIVMYPVFASKWPQKSMLCKKELFLGVRKSAPFSSVNFVNRSIKLVACILRQKLRRQIA